MTKKLTIELDQEMADQLADIFKAQELTLEKAFYLFAMETVATGKSPLEAGKPTARLRDALVGEDEDYQIFDSAEAGLKALYD